MLIPAITAMLSEIVKAFLSQHGAPKDELDRLVDDFSYRTEGCRRELSRVQEDADTVDEDGEKVRKATKKALRATEKLDFFRERERPPADGAVAWHLLKCVVLHFDVLLGFVLALCLYLGAPPPAPFFTAFVAFGFPPAAVRVWRDSSDIYFRRRSRLKELHYIVNDRLDKTEVAERALLMIFRTMIAKQQAANGGFTQQWMDHKRLTAVGTAPAVTSLTLQEMA